MLGLGDPNHHLLPLDYELVVLYISDTAAMLDEGILEELAKRTIQLVQRTEVLLVIFILLML